MSDVIVKGLAELQAAMQSLPAKIEANVLRGGLRAGVKVIRTAAKPPEKTGALKRSVKHGVKMSRGRAVGYVRAGRGAAFYAHMVEFGTKPHRITAGPGRYLSFGGRLAKSVWHPGSRARPFMAPAFESQTQAALEAMRDYITKRLADKHGINMPTAAEALDE